MLSRRVRQEAYDACDPRLAENKPPVFLHGGGSHPTGSQAHAAMPHGIRSYSVGSASSNDSDPTTKCVCHDGVVLSSNLATTIRRLYVCMPYLVVLNNVQMVRWRAAAPRLQQPSAAPHLPKSTKSSWKEPNADV